MDTEQKNANPIGDKQTAEEFKAGAKPVKAQEVRPPTIPNLPRGVTLVSDFYDNKFGRA